MADQLSALDATFLELEEADPSAHMHIGAVMVMEPQPGGGAPPLDQIHADVMARLPDLPRYTHRLSTIRTSGLRWPNWVKHAGFRVERHVRRAALPAPAGIDELVEWAGEYFSHRLDRTRPLWEIVILELADGRWAMVTKTHHCMIDGVGSVDIGTTLLDTQRERRVSPNAHANGDGDGSRTPPGDELTPSQLSRWRRTTVQLAKPYLAVGNAAVRAAESGLHAAESAFGIAVHPSRARDAVHRSKALAELLIRDELISAPKSSLNRPIGTGRRLAVLTAELDELKEIKNELGGTLNDVVLAVTAGGLRRLLEHRGEEMPRAGLRAMVPVNVRTAGDRLAMGNRISTLFVHLPVAEGDPKRRYERQMEDAETLKSGNQATGSTTLIDITRHMPPVIHSFMARSMYATRLFNLTITNVPGPQLPLYYFGSKVDQIWPLVPIAADHAVGLAVFSYDGTLYFCVNADRDTVPDLEVLREGIAESLTELGELAAKPTETG
ncbi:MAG: wax ester/triacylglycerol synthase family O-acyltransferase [Solirubrobacterales bacterium]